MGEAAIPLALAGAGLASGLLSNNENVQVEGFKGDLHPQRFGEMVMERLMGEINRANAVRNAPITGLPDIPTRFPNRQQITLPSSGDTMQLGVPRRLLPDRSVNDITPFLTTPESALGDMQSGGRTKGVFNPSQEFHTVNTGDPDDPRIKPGRAVDRPFLGNEGRRVGQLGTRTPDAVLGPDGKVVGTPRGGVGQQAQLMTQVQTVIDSLIKNGRL